MKQTIYVICENASAFATFAGYVNFLDFDDLKAPYEVCRRQSKWYTEHSDSGKKPVKVKANMTFDQFMFFVFSIYNMRYNKLYCQDGVFVLR